MNQNLYLFSDVDECTLNTDNCDINAECTNTVGSFECDCNDGYAGTGVTCTGIYLVTINKKQPVCNIVKRIAWLHYIIFSL